jgi:predicted regulator of Ras-like GTPase activity (Roadblock/LC7/MglB family)
MDKSTKIKFEKALDILEKTEGVQGTLVVDNQGEILHTSLRATDVSLFGSMANIISNSSEKLLDSVKQGLTERILVESKHGKALFMSLEKAHLVVLTNKAANIGMVMIASKTAAETIKEMPEIKELEIIEFAEVEVPAIPSETLEELKVVAEEDSISEPQISPAEVTATPVETKPEEMVEIEDKSILSKDYISESTVESTKPELAETTSAESAELIKESPESLTEEVTKIDEINISEKIEEPVPTEIKPEPIKETIEIVSEPIESVQTKEIEEPVKELKEEKGMQIPIIRPPLAFPPLPENVEIPEDMEQKTALIISIYESVLVAMSIGASKIMGFAPARGMLIKSLPYDKCPQTLNGVNVKSNSTLEFDKIKMNIGQLPLENRVENTIKDFTNIISAITDNYGRVMGYDAFRGMIRPEFKLIYASFGPAMEELGIKEKIHPELRELLVT